MSSNLRFDDEADPRPPSTRSAVRHRPIVPAGGGMSWWKLFSAVLAANLVAATIGFFAVRIYVYWSIADTMKQVNEKYKEKP